jgi:hypothetical protein
MSSITNIIRTVWTTDGQGRVRAAIGEMSGGLQQLTRGSTEYGRQTGYLNNQLRALGTTFRYSLAGAAIFGAYKMITTLQDTQKQLALIGFLGQESFGSLNEGVYGADRRLQDFYKNAQSGAREALTDVSSFNDALINLFSTVQHLNPQTAIKMTTVLSQAAQLAQITPEEMTKATAGLVQSYAGQKGQNLKNYGGFSRAFVNLISTVPGTADYGPQIAQQIPGLAAVGQLGKMSPQQLLGLFTTVLRTGVQPSTGGRGLQYLLQSIFLPNKTHTAALAQAGVTPSLVQQHGGLWAFNKVLAHARGLGFSGKQQKRVANLSDEQVDLIDQDPSAMRGLGISGAGLTWLNSAIGRIHGIRTFAQIASQGNKYQSDIVATSKAWADTAESVKKFKDSVDRFQKDQPLKAAAISLDNLRRDVISSLSPVVSPAAHDLDVVARAGHRHTTIEHAAVYGLGAALGLSALRRMRGGGGIMGGAGRLFGGAALIQSAANPTNVPTGSASNPFFVYVLSQLSNPSTPGGVIGKTGKTAEGNVSRASRLSRAAGRLSVYGAIGIAGFETGQYAAHHYILGATKGTNDAIEGFLGFGPNSNKGSGSILNVIGAHRGGRGVPYQFQSPMQQITGRADVYVNVDAFDHNGKPVSKRVHVPVTLIPNKNGVTPTHRGKPKTQKGN